MGVCLVWGVGGKTHAQVNGDLTKVKGNDTYPVFPKT